LSPLGKVVHLVEGGKPEALFSLAAGALPLEARLSGTHADGRASLDYHLVRNHREVAHVVETPSVVSMPFGTGYGRAFELIAGSARVHLALRDATQGQGQE